MHSECDAWLCSSVFTWCNWAHAFFSGSALFKLAKHHRAQLSFRLYNFDIITTNAWALTKMAYSSKHYFTIRGLENNSQLWWVQYPVIHCSSLHLAHCNSFSLCCVSLAEEKSQKIDNFPDLVIYCLVLRRDVNSLATHEYTWAWLV